MLCVLVLVGVLLSHNRAARHVLERRHLAALGVQSRAWVAERPLTAPLAFVAVYIGCALFCLPVWWLQILAGHAFGLAGGVFWTLVASSAGSAVTVFVSQWAGGDWVAARAGGKAARFQRLAAQLGNHGFAVVVASRLLFVLPYGLGNYLVGLTGIKARDAALGTLVGNLPIVAVYVAIGATFADRRVAVLGRHWGLGRRDARRPDDGPSDGRPGTGRLGGHSADCRHLGLSRDQHTARIPL